MSIYFLENVTIQDVSSSDYLAAIDLISELRLDPNDCLAVRVMRENEVDEIYTFDRGFEGVKGITRLPEL
ncbi:MAG TPA: PIN domain-containing protein [Archaeoglobaceae archaeon]|nr:PIN domain-containing protein [Archaeoglobaceae archaeon]